jgi:hypothetical protein
MKKIIIGLLAIASVAMLFTQCKKSSTSANLQIKLTDNPANYTQVNVDIKEVEVKFNEDTLSWVSLNTNAAVYNLLALQNGVTTVLATGNVPTNTVKEIRFVLGPNNTVLDSGVVHNLTIPSGSESGLKIKVSKKLDATLQTILIDFDAALSIKEEADGYKLKPVLKLK